MTHDGLIVGTFSRSNLQLPRIHTIWNVVALALMISYPSFTWVGAFEYGFAPSIENTEVVMIEQCTAHHRDKDFIQPITIWGECVRNEDT